MYGMIESRTSVQNDSCSSSDYNRGYEQRFQHFLSTDLVMVESSVGDLEYSFLSC